MPERTELALRKLDDYQRAGGYNVLTPVIPIIDGQVAASPVLAESLSVVVLDASKGSPDVYNDFRYADAQKGLFALSSLALSKIAAAAGVKWVPELCTVQERTRSIDGHVYVRYQAAGAIRQPNGEWHVELAMREIDTADEAEQLREADYRALRRAHKPDWAKSLPKDADGIERVIADRVKQRILQLREHILSHAETKAKSRVIRRLLSLPQVFTQKQLAMPFVVPRLIFRPDLADPMALEQVQIEGRRAASALFGDKAFPAANGTVAEGPSPQATSSEATPDQESGASESHRPDATGAPDSAQGEPPSDDPLIGDGDFEGKKLSKVAEISPAYLREIILGESPVPVMSLGETKLTQPRKVRLAKAWLQFYQPQLLGDEKQ